MKRNTAPPQGESEFYKHLMGEDELGVVVRAHMHIEQHVNACIEALLPYPEALKPMALDYHQKVHLLLALGLKEELKTPLLALGTLRNEFAHQMEVRLTKGRVDNFYRTFSGDDKQIIHGAFDRTRKKLSIGAKGKMKHKTPQDRFALYVVTLRSALIAGRKQVEKLVADAE